MVLKMARQRKAQEERKEKNKGRQPKIKEKPSKSQKLDGDRYKEKNYPDRAGNENIPSQGNKKDESDKKRTHDARVDHLR